MSEASFQRALDFVLSVEGGYVNDPKDPGGETKFGISKRAYPMVDVANLTRDDAAKIYRRDYWDPCHCDQLPDAIAMAVFDGAVNQGPVASVRMLQAALGLHVDGAVGPDTIAAAKDRALLGTLGAFVARRWDRYFDTGGASVFLRGWTRRLFKLQAECIWLAAASEA